VWYDIYVIRRLKVNMNVTHGIHNINSSNTDLNPICHLLALLGAHHILHVGRIGVKTTEGIFK
jgi:hypothetical protein